MSNLNIAALNGAAATIEVSDFALVLGRDQLGREW